MKNLKKFWQTNRKAILFILPVFLVWQMVIAFLAFVPSRILPPRPAFMYQETTKLNPHFLWPRANFDGVHYLAISRYGYGLYQQAFFPAYPRLISILKPLFGGRDLVAAVFIANFSLLIFLFLFYKIIRLDYQERVARRALVFFLLFPTSFFLGMVYTESLFLCLAVGSFYAARKGNWWLAGVLGALTSYTRLVGVFLLPALVWEWYQQNRSQVKARLGSLSSVLLIPLGLLTYMKFLWENYKDPLLFFHVQPHFGAERSGGKIILLYQVFWRYLKMALTTRWDPLYFTVWLEILTAVGFLFLLYLAFKKGLRSSYLIFALSSFLVPTFSGTFSSLPRYALSLFPCFIFLGMIENKFIRKALVLIFAVVAIVSAVFFYRGSWVA